MSLYKFTKGFTLLEMLIALFLTLMIISATTELLFILFANLKMILLHQQFETRSVKAFYHIERALQNAGYVGCQKLSSATAKYLGIIPLHIEQNSITVQYMEPMASKLIHQNEQLIVISPPLKIKVHDKLIIGDCRHIELVTIVNIKQNKLQQQIKLSKPLNHDYDAAAEVGPLRIEHLFVDGSHEHQPNGTKIYSLFMKNLHQSKSLVVGITALNLKFLYKDPTNRSSLNDVLSCEFSYSYFGFKKIAHKFMMVGYS